jgi:hypothetical protein
MAPKIHFWRQDDPLFFSAIVLSGLSGKIAARIKGAAKTTRITLSPALAGTVSAGTITPR